MLYFNNLVRDVKKELSHYLLDNICKEMREKEKVFIIDDTDVMKPYGKHYLVKVGIPYALDNLSYI